jgi:capsular exopolysaccharide synthesis family protein
MSEEIEKRVVSRLPASLASPRRFAVQDIQHAGERPAVNVLLVAWRRRWTVIACVLVAVALGVYSYKHATRIYSSNSIVYIQQNLPRPLTDDAFTSAGNSASYLATQCSLIQSTVILSDALKEPGVLQTTCLRSSQNPVGFLKSSVTAQPSKQGDLIVVSMESTDPQAAAIIVNAVVQAYIDYQSKQHQSTAVEIIKFLQKSADEHEQELKGVQQKMLALKKANPELAVQTARGGIASTRLSDLYSALAAAQFRSLDLKSAEVEAEASSGDPLKLRRILDQVQLGGEISPTADPQLIGEFHQQERELEALLDAHLGECNAAVIDARKKLDRLQSEIQKSTQAAIASCVDLLQAARRSSDDRVKQLDDALKAERLVMMELNTKQAEYDEYAQEADQASRSLDVLRSRIKDINVNEDVGSLSVSVLETAVPDYGPIRPVASKVIGTDMIGGLMAGLLLAILRDLMDQRLRNVEEIVTILDLPVIGAVPRIPRLGSRRDSGREIHLRPRSGVAEAYRTIRTAIYFGLDEGHLYKTIMVTSPSPGEGKSTCVGNLAIAISQAGRKVLILDADCRRPSQHKIFKLAEGKGLSDLLSGTATLDEAIQKTDVDRLEVIPCGVLPPNPAELLDSQTFLDLLKDLSTRYDQIIVDSPPLLPVSDARILAASCDSVLMLLRAQRSTRRLARLARDALASVGANVIGVVINDVTKNGNGYDYTYYGYGRYGNLAPEKPKNGSNGSNGNGHANGSSLIHEAKIMD